MKKIWIYVSLAVLVAGLAMAAFLYSGRMARAVSGDCILYVPTGSGYGQLCDSLQRNNRVNSISRFKFEAEFMRLPERIRPGRYQLKKGMSYKSLVRMLNTGGQSPVRVTFNNIRTIDRLAGNFSRQLESDSTAFAAFLYSDTTAGHYGFSPATFISMFIPNTYEFYWNSSPKVVADRMKREYDKFWAGEREEKLRSLGMTRDEVTTLASIVYEETKKSDEMATVAGVYLNRLRQGMPLQADPTVKFAIGDFSIKRVLNRHLEIASPYNTYKNTGLPPGPVCMPSIRAIDAVLENKRHDYYYFCARADFSGYHVFATNLAAHNRNAQEYYRALDRIGIRK